MAKELVYTKTPNNDNPLSLSTLRDILNGATGTTQTKLSDYYKGSFNVPDATVNQSVPVAGSGPGGANPPISFSQLRGRLSRIACKITGTEYNVNTNSLFTLDGNNEYGGNLRKSVQLVSATVGASAQGNYAFTVNAGLGGNSLDIDVGPSAQIIGYRGAQGGAGGGQGSAGGQGSSGGPAFINSSGKTVNVYGGGTVKGGGGAGGGGGGGGREGNAGRNSFGQCNGWFCPSQRQVCGNTVGGGGQGGGGGGTGGLGSGSLWNGSTIFYASKTAGDGGQGPRGAGGGSGGEIGQGGQAGGQGTSGPTGPGGNCQGGGGGQGGGSAGPGGSAGASFVGPSINVSQISS